MQDQMDYDVIIVGGGLAGLTAALHLSNKSIRVLLIEKNKYPHHKVCGEYVSNEVLPYLHSLGIDPFAEGAIPISKFEISNHLGKKVDARLPLGGFGISRFQLDYLLYREIRTKVTVLFDVVETIELIDDAGFSVKTKTKDKFTSRFVVGAYGKRSALDVILKRSFITKKSPWLAVKAHYRYEQPKDTVSLHNFQGGYCGISAIEEDKVNACYLTTYKSFQKIGAIELFQKEILSKNPHLNHFFVNAQPIFDRPLSISQISFDKKAPVASHILMVGDTAGLIHPLCGNGMAMAIHSAKLCSELLIDAVINNVLRSTVEQRYTTAWQEAFYKRLQIGRMVQSVLLHPKGASIGLKTAKLFPSILPKIIKKTHGELLV